MERPVVLLLEQTRIVSICLLHGSFDPLTQFRASKTVARDLNLIIIFTNKPKKNTKSGLWHSFLHQSNAESRIEQKQQFTFKIGDIVLTEPTNAYHSTSFSRFLRCHIPRQHFNPLIVPDPHIQVRFRGPALNLTLVLFVKRTISSSWPYDLGYGLKNTVGVEEARLVD